jgi:hypothetical protein
MSSSLATLPRGLTVRISKSVTSSSGNKLPEIQVWRSTTLLRRFQSRVNHAVVAEQTVLQVASLWTKLKSISLF